MLDVNKRRTTTLLLVAGAIVLSLGTGFWIPRLFHAVEPLEDESLYVSREAGESTFAGGNGLLQTDRPGEAVSEPDNGGNVRKPTASDGLEPADNNSGVTTLETDLRQEEQDQITSSDVPPLSDEAWMQQRIQDVEDQVAPEDLEDFQRITRKLDMGRVEAILAGGITEEATDELRAYLRSRLTGDEYARAKELFTTYLHLLAD